MTKRSIARRVSKFRMQARHLYSRLTDVSPSVYLNILLGFWVVCLATMYFGRPAAEPEIKVGDTAADYNWFGQPGAVKPDPPTAKAPTPEKESKPATAKATAGGAVAAPSVQVAAATAVRPVLVKPPKKGKKKSGFFIPPPPPIGLVAPPPPTVPIPQSIISMGPGAAGAMTLTAPPPALPQWAINEPTMLSYGSGYDPSYSNADVDNASLYARSVSRVITVRHRKKTIALK